MKNFSFLTVLVCALAAAALLFPACEEITGAVPPPRNIMRPYISEQPESSSYFINSFTAPALTAKIERWNTGDGALSYQWFKFRTVEEYFNNEGGQAIGTERNIDYGDTNIVRPNSDGSVDITLSYTPNDITAPADNDQYYYYVVVTNTDSEAGDSAAASVQSEIAAVSFSAAGSPLFPVIVTNPYSAAYTWGAPMNDLRVRARLAEASPATDTLSYQWRRKTYVEASKTYIDEDVDDENKDRFTVDFQKHGLKLNRNIFFAEVTNTNSSNAKKTAVSIPAVLNIRPAYAAAPPVITKHPKDALYFTGEPIAALTVKGESTDSGDITYQWYVNNANSNKGGSVIGGETKDSYKPSGAGFYYAVVTNTNEFATNRKTAGVSSLPARISVAAAKADDAANVYLTIPDISQTTNQYQYIRGYGGMDVAWGNFPRTSQADTELMYDPDRLGYNILRIMIRADYTDPARTIAELLASDRPDYYENVKIVNKYGGYVLASPWTPPKDWKTNNSINGGGKLIPNYYPLFAQYLRNFAQNMADNGAPVFAISISNEPNYVAGYDGCEWDPEDMMNFFVSQGRFTDGIRGWGGGRETPYVLRMNGESANTPYINNAALTNPISKDAIDLIARHIYGERSLSLWNDFPENLRKGDVTDHNQGKIEVWMTEHNINSSNATGYYNDSKWNYVWKFLNDVDLSMRLNNENAFVWWAGKRFYSMVGDGQFGTSDGDPLPRGWALAHYARFTTGMTRVAVNLTPGRDSKMGNGMEVQNTEQSGSILNRKYDDMDKDSACVTAYVSQDQKEVSLVMWTPTKTNGSGGYDMGTVRVELPTRQVQIGGSGVTQQFKASGVTAVRSFGDRANRLFQPYDVQLNNARTVMFVNVPNSHIVSIKLTGDWE